jgi:hypothetical protein
MRSCDHVIICPCDRAIVRSCDHAIMRSCDHAIMRSCDRLLQVAIVRVSIVSVSKVSVSHLSRRCGSRKTRNDCSQKKLWASWSDGQAVVPAFIVTIFRLIWLGVMVLSYHGPRGGEAFVLLASIQGVKDVVGSIIEAAYSVRRRPREGQWTWRAVRLYHKLVEPSWSHLIPCAPQPVSPLSMAVSVCAPCSVPLSLPPWRASSTHRARTAQAKDTAQSLYD